MVRLRFFAVLEMPAEPLPNSFYFVLNDDRAESWLTSSSGEPKKMGNTEMIRNIVEGIIGEAGSRYSSVAEFVADRPPTASTSVHIVGYYGGWAGTVEGPKGGFTAHKTGYTAASPSVGNPVTPSTIGTGGQAGLFWTADGAEWKRSHSLADDLADDAKGAAMVGYEGGTVASKLTEINGEIADIAQGARGLTWDRTEYPLYAAHRGQEMSFPENTLVAFEETYSAGGRAVELDVQMMADGELVVMHDPTTGRTCRDAAGNPIDLTIAEITPTDLYGLDASFKRSQNTGFYGSDFENNKPPLFKEVLSGLKGKLLFLAEAKGSNIPATAQAMCDLAESLMMQGSVLVMSTVDLLANPNFDSKGCPIGYMEFGSVEKSLPELQAIADRGYFTFGQDKNVGITEAYKNRVNSTGMRFLSWTYWSPKDVDFLADVVVCGDIGIVRNQRIATGQDFLMRKYLGPGYFRSGVNGGISPGTSPIVYPVIRTLTTTDGAARRYFGWPQKHPSSADGRTKIGIANIDPDPNNDGNYTLEFDLVWTEISSMTNRPVRVSWELDIASTIDFGAHVGAGYNENSLCKRCYTLDICPNGNWYLQRYDESNNAAPVTLDSGVGALPNPASENTRYSFRIQMTTSGITVTFDPDGAPITLTSGDTTYRDGKYFQLDRSGHGVMIGALRAS